MSKAVCEFPVPPADFPYRAVRWKGFVKAGSFGDACAATAEYGQKLVDEIVETTSGRILQFLT